MIIDNHLLWAELNIFIIIRDKKNFFMALIDFGALVYKKKNYDCLIYPFLDLCKYDQKSF